MRSIWRPMIFGVIAAALSVSTASLAETAHQGRSHRHRQAHRMDAARPASAPVATGQADSGLVASPDSVGSLFGGLGSAYDNSAFGYDGPLGFGARAKAQVGSALLGGGAAGDAYTNYLQHYYFYKYDYCPIGSKYVWYLQRCFGLADLFH